MTVFTGQVSSWVTTTFFSVIVFITVPAALFTVLIRLIITLWFTVTVLRFSDTTTIVTGPLGSWVAAANFSVVELEALEATFTVIGSTFVRTIITINLTITTLGKRDALVARFTSPLGLRATAVLWIV
jgi:hypothetical protein